MDLHDWITRQVDAAERTVRDVDKEHGRVWGTLWDQRTDSFQILDASGTLVATNVAPGAAGHVALHNPAAVLRRCEADRRVLDRHTPHTSGSTDCVTRCERAHFGIQVCNYDGHGWPCEDLTDLATAHGRNEDQSTSKEQA